MLHLAARGYFFRDASEARQAGLFTVGAASHTQIDLGEGASFHNFTSQKRLSLKIWEFGSP